jgi:O-antigen ligase
MDDGVKLKITKLLLFSYLLIFPFGQLFRINVGIGNFAIPIFPTDLIAGLLLITCLISKYEKPKFFKAFLFFILAALFSSVFSLTVFKSVKVIYGSLYLLRFISYASLVQVTYYLSKRGEKIKSYLFNFLIIVSLAVAVFGWYQYIFYPDLRSLYYWGWDDHYYRLVGTFLDPTFTAIILVFGFILSFAKALVFRRNRNLILAGFFLLTLAFTYSRAGYLALLAGSVSLLYLTKRLKRILLVFLALLILIIFLPRPSSEGVHLERIKSILSRLNNYQQTVEVIKRSPLFGFGFNNFCLAEEKYLGSVDYKSHSCSGSDSSILLIFATTGIVGLIIFFNLVYVVLNNLSKNIYGLSFQASLIAIIIHSLFSNSLFYPWVMGYLAILLGLAIKEEKAKE